MAHIMTGAELASQQKSQIDISALGQDAPDLHLSEADTAWWREARLGLFIHWGVFAAVGKGEWSYFNEHFTEEAYREVARTQFLPSREPDEIAAEWVETAKLMDAKYMVMVARHHDGYALWDSPSSWKHFTSMEVGPHRDYVDAYVRACRAAGLGCGIYYSPMDWRFPGYFDPAGQPENAQLMKEQAWGQIREICSQWKPDILWYDGGWLAHHGTDADAAPFWDAIGLARMARSYNPRVMMTPRSGYVGDFTCQEGPKPVTGPIVDHMWEKCFSLATSWGFIPGDTYKTGDFLIASLVNTASRGGNLLLNVGPDVNGRIPDEEREALVELGDWMRRNGRSIRGTRAGAWQPVDDVFASTRTDSTIYLHILDPQAFGKLTLPPIGETITAAAPLDDPSSPLDFTQDEHGVRIELPDRLIQARCIDTIVALDVKR